MNDDLATFARSDRILRVSTPGGPVVLAGARSGYQPQRGVASWVGREIIDLHRDGVPIGPLGIVCKAELGGTLRAEIEP